MMRSPPVSATSWLVTNGAILCPCQRPSGWSRRAIPKAIDLPLSQGSDLVGAGARKLMVPAAGTPGESGQLQEAKDEKNIAPDSPAAEEHDREQDDRQGGTGDTIQDTRIHRIPPQPLAALRSFCRGAAYLTTI